MNECLEIRSVGDDCQDGCQEDECKAGNLSAMLMKAPPKMFPGREAAMDEAPETVIGWNGWARRAEPNKDFRVCDVDHWGGGIKGEPMGSFSSLDNRQLDIAQALNKEQEV